MIDDVVLEDKLSEVVEEVEVAVDLNEMLWEVLCHEEVVAVVEVAQLSLHRHYHPKAALAVVVVVVVVLMVDVVRIQAVQLQ